MDAEERHGFEGDGFTYLKSPIWWAGIVARTSSAPFTFHPNGLLTTYSNRWRSSKLCRLRFRACNSSYTAWGVECPNRCRVGIVFLEGGVGDIGKAWMCHLPHWIRDNCASCATGPGD